MTPAQKIIPPRVFQPFYYNVRNTLGGFCYHGGAFENTLSIHAAYFIQVCRKLFNDRIRPHDFDLIAKATQPSKELI